MGSQSDWQTMRHAAETLDALGVSYEARIVSAHRTPERLYAFAKGAKAAGFKVIIAGAGGAAHLPGMTAALTSLPVFGVPIESKALSGLELALFDRADAAGRSGRDAGNRAGGRGQRGAARRKRLGVERSGAGGPARCLAAASDGRRRRGAEGWGRVSVLAPVLAPGATIGILGGGQLGRMLALAAARIGFKCQCSHPHPTRRPSTSCTA